MPRILIVEDEPNMRMGLTDNLEYEGYEVENANNGEDGLKAIINGKFDLIVLDVMMPKMDGLDVLRALKSEPPVVANGPVVLLTNVTHDPVINMAKDLGVKDNLVKSDITPGDLLEYINKMLGIDASKPEQDQRRD